jgi:hypothetical protein
MSEPEPPVDPVVDPPVEEPPPMPEEEPILPPVVEVPPISPADALPVVTTPAASDLDNVALNAAALAAAAAQAELQAATLAADQAIIASAKKWKNYARSGNLFAVPNDAIPLNLVANYVDGVLAVALLNQTDIFPPERQALWQECLAPALASETIETCAGYFRRMIMADFREGARKPPVARRPSVGDGNAVTTVISNHV